MADELYHALVEFLEREAWPRHQLWLPPQAEHKVGPMVWLHRAAALDCRREGLLLPAWLSVMGPRYFSLQNRLNRFHISLPFETAQAPPLLVERFAAIERLTAVKRCELPNFAVLTSSLFVP
jgi:hypothetical protein